MRFGPKTVAVCAHLVAACGLALVAPAGSFDAVAHGRALNGIGGIVGLVAVMSIGLDSVTLAGRRMPGPVGHPVQR